MMEGVGRVDGVVDEQRTGALQILDGAHAAQEVSAIGQLAHAAGSMWLSGRLFIRLQELAHQGRSVVHRQVRRPGDPHPDIEELFASVTDVQKRESRMPSPQSHAAGWPSGSGIVERGDIVFGSRIRANAGNLLLFILC